MNPKPYINCCSVDYYEKGVQAPDFQPGDFILTRGKNWISWLIRFVQAVRFRGDDRIFAFWNHAAIVVTEEGDLVEALGKGVAFTHISKYTPKEYILVRIEASEEDRIQAAKFAFSCLGSKYGLLNFLSIGFCLLTGAKIIAGIDGTYICSALVARALERTDARFDKSPIRISPADLARYYHVGAEQ